MLANRRSVSGNTDGDENSEQCTVADDGSFDCSSLVARGEKIPQHGYTAWRQTRDCDPFGEREPEHDMACNDIIAHGKAGYCECTGGRKVMLVNCIHSLFTCKSACGGKNSGEEMNGSSPMEVFSRQCGGGEGLAVYPKKGDALLFYSQTPEARLDKMSYHGGCPVIRGTKWGANVWIWNRKRPVFNKDNINGNGPTNVHASFVNNRGFTVDLYWINHDNVLALFHTFPPGHAFNLNTHLGHRWVVKRKDTGENIGKEIQITREKATLSL